MNNAHKPNLVRTQTAKPKSNVDISPLIDALLPTSINEVFMTYKYTIPKEGGEVLNQQFQRKTNFLLYLLNYLSDPINRNDLTYENYQDLIALIQIHIFRPIPILPPANAFSEIYFDYVVQNWQHIDICHLIFQTILADPNFTYSLFDNQFSFAQRLVQQLDSPSVDEQLQVESDIQLILVNFPGKRSSLLHYMLEKVLGYMDSKLYVASIAPLLRLFLDYFKSLPLPISQSHFLIFRNVFYPLFATEFAPEFERELHALSSFFQSKDPALSKWCLFFLKNHWPQTSPRKTILFLHQLSTLLPFLPGLRMQVIAPVILKILAPLIKSENSQISIAASIFCGNPGFLSVYRQMPELISDIILPSVKEALNHWNDDVYPVIKQLNAQLTPFDLHAKKTKPHPAEKTSKKDKWIQIAQVAASNDTSFSDFENKINNFFSEKQF